MEIAALIPTLNRPEGLKRVLLSLKDTAPDVFRVVARDYDDCQAQNIATRLANAIVVTPEKRQGPAKAWNAALQAAPGFDAYVLAADDLIFRKGWLEATLRKLEELGGSGLVGFNDGKVNHDTRFSTHYLMTRDFMIEHHGGVMAVPFYDGDGPDVEASERAQRAGLYAYAEDAHVFHDWKGSRLSNQGRFHNRLRIQGRRRAGWPDDFKAVIT